MAWDREDDRVFRLGFSRQVSSAKLALDAPEQYLNNCINVVALFTPRRIRNFYLPAHAGAHALNQDLKYVRRCRSAFNFVQKTLLGCLQRKRHGRFLLRLCRLPSNLIQMQLFYPAPSSLQQASRQRQKGEKTQDISLPWWLHVIASLVLLSRTCYHCWVNYSSWT